MKKEILILCLFFMSALSISAQDMIDDGKKLGLVSYLTYVKSLSEFKMSSLVSNEEYTTKLDKAKSFNTAYNLLKLATDKLINQLSADLYNSNRLKLYNKINQYLQDKDNRLPSHYTHYEVIIKEVDDLLQSFLIKTYSSALSGPSIENIMGIVGLGHGILTDARDFREKKIKLITGVINELRLRNLADLVNSKEKE